jgi:phosphoribosylformimino-5-aminoimidazole carboxamide ribotide isomerase
MPTHFEVIPAVDLLDDGAVTLEQGDFERVRARADPLELVGRFAAASARLIHVVDLDGARSGRLRTRLIARLAEEAAPARVQASGGIRSPADAQELLEAGAARVVVGTAAFENGDSLGRYASALGERLVVALDARGGRVALAGWQQTTALAVGDAAARCAAAGVARILCTAIARDGTLAGPDLELLTEVCDRSGLPVLAAGGIGSEADLEAVRAAGCEAAIVGRALLDGSLSLSVLRANAGCPFPPSTFVSEADNPDRRRKR